MQGAAYKEKSYMRNLNCYFSVQTLSGPFWPERTLLLTGHGGGEFQQNQSMTLSRTDDDNLNAGTTAGFSTGLSLTNNSFAVHLLLFLFGFFTITAQRDIEIVFINVLTRLQKSYQDSQPC